MAESTKTSEGTKPTVHAESYTKTNWYKVEDWEVKLEDGTELKVHRIMYRKYIETTYLWSASHLMGAEPYGFRVDPFTPSPKKGWNVFIVGHKDRDKWQAVGYTWKDEDEQEIQWNADAEVYRRKVGEREVEIID